MFSFKHQVLLTVESTRSKLLKNFIQRVTAEVLALFIVGKLIIICQDNGMLINEYFIVLLRHGIN